MNIYVERINRGLTISEVAETCDVARSTLVKAEGGEMPQPPQAKRIADFYGVRVTDIWPVPEPVEEAGAR